MNIYFTVLIIELILVIRRNVADCGAGLMGDGVRRGLNSYTSVKAVTPQKGLRRVLRSLRPKLVLDPPPNQFIVPFPYLLSPSAFVSRARYSSV